VIGSAVQRGAKVVIYDLHGRLLYTKVGTLLGFTSHATTVKEGSRTQIYDAVGHHLAWLPG
jgi:hypothetical protein